MTKLALTTIVAAGALAFAGAASAGTYTPFAYSMLRDARPAAEAYYFDHNSYSGMTFQQLRWYDPSISTVELKRATKNNYCMQVNVLGDWAHATSPLGDNWSMRPGRCR